MSDTETDEWTPSTEQVRSHYVFNQSNQWDGERGEAFDRWLADHDAEVRAEAIEASAAIADQYAEARGRPRVGAEALAARDVAARIRRDAAHGVVAEEPDMTALRAARAETWDEAISAVFAWWSTPENERPAAIVNPYGLGVPVKQEGPET